MDKLGAFRIFLDIPINICQDQELSGGIANCYDVNSIRMIEIKKKYSIYVKLHIGVCQTSIFQFQRTIKSHFPLFAIKQNFAMTSIVIQ